MQSTAHGPLFQDLETNLFPDVFETPGYKRISRKDRQYYILRNIEKDHDEQLTSAVKTVERAVTQPDERLTGLGTGIDIDKLLRDTLVRMREDAQADREISEAARELESGELRCADMSCGSPSLVVAPPVTSSR